MKKLTAYQIIDAKKHHKELSFDEIKWFVEGCVSGTIPKYQLSALLMAIYLNGMTTKETAALTKVMLESGEQLKFKGAHYVDKHSTGGIGDKASFILGPIAAACGVKVPMIAGRGLGHTGGTIDKVESIDGFKTNLSSKKFKEVLAKYNFVLNGQTSKIAPADGLIYSVRDVTATIESVPLITASIMSKKLAEGANGIVMDIKTGSGSFMKTPKRAKELAVSILNTAKQFKKGASALLTDMSQPLGNAVGNSLEIIESVETLKGNGPKDLTKLSVELAAHMVLLGKKAKSIEAARSKCLEVIENGKAYAVFEKVILAQGGKLKSLNNQKVAKQATIVKAKKSGYLKDFKNAEIGLKLVDLGGGRKIVGEKIDHSVGFIFHHKIGDKIKKGAHLVTIYHHKKQANLVKRISKEFSDSIITISSTIIKKPRLISKVIV